MHAFAYQIRLVVIGAQNIPNVSTMGKLDAFAKITYQGTEYCTSVIRNSGTNPIWNYILSFNGDCPLIHIEIFDKRLLVDKYIGECTIDCSRIPHGDHCFLIPMTDHGVKNSKCGSLRVNISLTKSVNDYAHKPVISVTTVPVSTPIAPPVLAAPNDYTHKPVISATTVPVATPILSAPTLSVHPELQPCIALHPTPGVATGVLLSERPDLLRRGSSRHFHMQQPFCECSRKRGMSGNRPLYSMPNEMINRRMNCKCYPIIPPSKY